MLNSVLEYQLPIAQTAEIMGISERHTKRLLAAYRKEGPAALAHGNRGRKPRNTVPEDVAAAVVKLASNGYAGANHSHFTELLREWEEIELSRPTVRRILVKAGIGSPRSRRSQQHRFRRKRMPQEGMLIQVDGSHHPWLGERADSSSCSSQWTTPPPLWPRRYSTIPKTRGAIWSCWKGWCGSGESPWPCTATATRPSSTTPAGDPYFSSPPSSRRWCGSWASSRSSPCPHRPRAG